MNSQSENTIKEMRLHSIASSIFNEIETGAFGDLKPGLYGGKAGIYLFLSHYLRCYPSPDGSTLLERFADDYADDLVSRRATTHTWCDGLAGIFALFRHLAGNSLTEFDLSEVEKEYRGYMLGKVAEDLADDYYDLFHGAMGVAMNYPDDPEFAGPALGWLERNAVKDDIGGIKWYSWNILSQKRVCNISLSHGISGILLALCRMHLSGAVKDHTGALIDGAASYLMTQRIDRERYGSCFPSFSIESDDSPGGSRLAWCYGDPGIAAALWQAGKALDNGKWKSTALDVMLHSAGRTDVRKANIFDSGLCHGSAGLAMIFGYMFAETARDEFRKAHEYWISQTLEMALFPDGPGGYKTYMAREDDPWKVDYSLLGGVAGTGMSLLSSIRPDVRDSRWTELFML